MAAVPIRGIESAIIKSIMQFDENLSQVQSDSQQQRLVEDDSTNYDDDWVNFDNDDEIS